MISICIITHKRPEQIPSTIENLVSEFGDQYPIFILDNGSLDETRVILEGLSAKYKQLSIFFSDKNLGVAEGRYFLWKKVGTPFILSLDDDIIISKSALISMINAMRKDIRIAVVSPNIIDSKSNGIINGGVKLGKLGGFYEACFLVRTNVVVKLGGFDANLIYAGEGLDYALRLHEAGFLVHRDINASVIHHDRKRVAVDWYLRRQQWLWSFCYVYWKNCSLGAALYWSTRTLLAHAKNGTPSLGLAFLVSLPRHAFLGSVAGVRQKAVLNAALKKP